MKRLILVRALSDEEREGIVASLCSPDVFVVCRCQILLTLRHLFDLEECWC
jgi:hypothetical protein